MSATSKESIDALAFNTYAAKASSLVVSTALINETISANESLSASAEAKIASTLPFSVAISLDKPASIASKETTSAEIYASKESTESSTKSNPCLMSHALAIVTLLEDVMFDHVIVLKKSEICFERICAIIILNLFFAHPTLL